MTSRGTTWRRLRVAALPVVVMVVAGCGFATDPATRLAFDIEAAAGRLSSGNGARSTIEHRTPSRSGECEGPYTVQLDEVGAIIVWCRDAGGDTVSSHSTSYHSRFVDTPRTYYLEKTAGSTLTIELERRGDRIVVLDAR